MGTRQNSAGGRAAKASGVRLRGVSREQQPRLVVLVAEDDELLAQVIAEGLKQDCDTLCVASVRQAAALVVRPLLHGALIDVGLADGNGTRLLPPLREAHPKIPVILMTGAGDLACSHAAFTYDASFLTKPMPSGWLTTFVTRARAAEAALSLRSGLVQLGLSPAEVAVFEALATGRTAADVADSMGLSVFTVRTHCMNVHRRLGAASLAEVLSIAAGWTSGR